MSKLQVTEGLFNAFIGEYNAELKFTVEQTLNTVQAMENEFHADMEEELEGASVEKAEKLLREYAPGFLERLSKEIILLNSENMSDSAVIKQTRVVRSNRVSTIISQLYQVEIPSTNYVMDNFVVDAYTKIYKEYEEQVTKADATKKAEELVKENGIVDLLK